MSRIAQRNPLVARWRRLGVRPRLMAIHVVLLTIVVAAIVVQSDRLLTARLNSQFNRDLTEEPVEFRSAAAIRPPGQSLATFTRSYLDTHLHPSTLSLIVRLEQRPGEHRLFISPDTPKAVSTTAVRTLLGRPVTSTALVDLTIAGSHYRASAAPIVLGGRRVATLLSVRNLAHLQADSRSQFTITLLEGLAALIAAVLAGYLLLRRVLRVVAGVTGAAEHAARGDLSLRLGYQGPEDELGRLARTVDTMLDRLEGSYSAQRRLLSDVSHQLRTPLTVIRGHLEVLQRQPDADADERAETIALVVDELEHVSLMVERLLLLGRALEPDFIEAEPIEVPALLQDVFDAAEYLAPRRWELEPGPPVVIRGDRTKLRGALLNLIDNAVKATHEEDTIRLAARCDGELVLEVADTGRGLSEADQERLFKRFSRSSDAYRGSGLGLAIVKAVVEAHGGRVELSSSPGAGSSFRLVLPRSRVERRPLETAVAG